jgi:hypothetical protein
MLRNAVLIVLAISTVSSTAVAQKRIPVEPAKQNISCPVGEAKLCRKLVEEAAERYCVALKYKSGWPARYVQLGDMWTLQFVRCE